MIRHTLVFVGLLSLTYCAVTKKDRVIEQKPLSNKEPGSEDYDHEAFLGEQKAEEFDQLSEEESMRRLGILVDRIDKNQDRHVDKEELKAWIEFTQKRYAHEDAVRQFSYSGKDENGHMTWDEYYKSTYSTLKGEELEDSENGFSYKKMIDRDRRRWDVADVTGDKALSLEEFKTFLHPEEFPHMKSVVLDETIDDIDKDKDGKIDIEEYIGDMYSKEDGEEPEWLKSERDQFISHRDANKDGYLDKDEVASWILPDNYDHVEAEAAHLIYESDDDKDEVLTKEEILAHHSTFVGSQITNWGDDLAKHDEF